VERRSPITLLIIATSAIALALVLLVTRDDTAAPTSTTTTQTVIDDSTRPTDSTTEAPGTEPPEEYPTTSATEATPAALPPGTTVCDAYTTITEAGTVASTDLVEASGLAASRTRPGVLWSHNDSRDGARVYAIGSDGADLGGFDVAGALAFDWEDMAAGPGSDPATSMLYFGDIGDNFSIRSGRVTVYRVPEPDLSSLVGPIQGTATLEFAYPDGVHNAEALFVAGDSIYIVTKDREETRIYRSGTAGDGSTVKTLELVTVLALDAEVSGADLSWDGSTIAFRGYQSVWMWHVSQGGTIADALSTEPCNAPSPEEVQGESIAFLSDGSYVTISEGANPSLFVIARDS